VEQDCPTIPRLLPCKVEVMPKCAIRSLQDFSIWYTPGVAQVCKDIEKDKELAFEGRASGTTLASSATGHACSAW